MSLSRRRFMALALGTVTAMGAEREGHAAASTRIGLLRSAASLRVSGWVGAWEADGSQQALERLGFDVRILHDGDLARAAFDDIDVLVAANARCIAPEAARRVQAWVEGGGRLLALGLSSYRTDRNQKATPDNNFQWAPLYGADFQRWVRAWPQCEFLDLDAKLAREVGALMRGPSVHRVQLGRNTAMLVRPRDESVVLATWTQADGVTPTADSGSASAAIVQRERVIYCGENLLAPELSRSPQVIALVLALLRRLDPNAPLQVPSALLASPAAIAFPAGPSEDVSPGGPTLRVGLDAAPARAGLSSRGGLTVRGAEANLPVAADHTVTLTAETGTAIRLRAGDVETVLEGPLEVTPKDRRQPLQFLHLRPNGTSRVQGFRGSLVVTARDGGLRLTNLISAEEYTAGVVPNETPAVYPVAALRAMAVIARTFAVSRVGYHRARGYDVCSTVDCQMYGGWLSEWDQTNRAVNATRDVIATFDGKPADTTFHAVCGGVGEAVQCVWPQPPTAYLDGGPDGPSTLPDLSTDEALIAFLERPPESFCGRSPRFRWRETYTLAQLQGLFEKSLPVILKSSGVRLGTLREVRVLERSPRGRVLKLAIDGTDGQHVVQCDRIRWLWSGGLVGQGGLQSTLFCISPNPDGTLEIRGGGWGHGVGMCQDGAAGMATRGHDYRAIIRHYYPGTEIADLGNAPTRSAAK